jgi:hypothetical protein
MIVENAPALRAGFHYQGKRPARGDLARALQDVAPGHQRQPRPERPDLEFLEVEAVSLGPPLEARSVALADEIEAMARMASVYKGRRALGSVVRHESV